MKMKYVPKYVSPSGTVIEFFPVDNVPGFTHRVVINGMSKDWMSGQQKPSAKVAVFFCKKHCGKTAAS